MVTPKIVLDINTKYSSMNPAMQSLSDYIIKNFDQVAYMGISELAVKSGVSDATVSRYAKIMGFKNYKAFQLEMVSSLKQAEHNKETSPYQRLDYGGIGRKDSIELICKKVIRSNIQMLEDTLFIMDYDLIDKISKLIINARNVVFFAVGKSSITAESGRIRLQQFGINAFCYKDPHEQIIAANMCNKEDIIIAISNNGRAKSVVSNTKRAKENGATVIGITSAMDSPLAKTVEYTLYTAYNYESFLSTVNNLSYEPTTENITQIALLDCICMSIAQKCKKETLEHYQRISSNIEEERLPK